MILVDRNGARLDIDHAAQTFGVHVRGQRLDHFHAAEKSGRKGIERHRTAPPFGEAGLLDVMRTPSKVVPLRSASMPRILTKRPSPVSASSDMPGRRCSASAALDVGHRADLLERRDVENDLGLLLDLLGLKRANR